MSSKKGKVPGFCYVIVSQAGLESKRSVACIYLCFSILIVM